jgi:hypothetical protein
MIYVSDENNSIINMKQYFTKAPSGYLKVVWENYKVTQTEPEFFKSANSEFDYEKIKSNLEMKIKKIKEDNKTSENIIKDYVSKNLYSRAETRAEVLQQKKAELKMLENELRNLPAKTQQYYDDVLSDSSKKIELKKAELAELQKKYDETKTNYEKFKKSNSSKQQQ